jgi:protein tyrosine phosphatase (PTP) superfamily phosphohydrolase (DUF442 family)
MFEEIYNFLALSESLFTRGMPKAEQLTDAAQQGIQVVINLALHDIPNALPEEEKLVKSLGMTYFNIPVVWTNPTRENLNEFLDVMDAHSDEKVLVHCEANYRATAFPALYRILRLGWKPEDALGIMHQIWNEEKYPIWKNFIEESIQNRGHDKN